VAEIRANRIVGIEEKPARPKSNYAVTGLYMYDGSVFDKIKVLQPSDRGELEITDVNNLYIQEGTMTFGLLEGWWTDAGTIDSLLRATNLVAETGANKVHRSQSAGQKSLKKRPGKVSAPGLGNRRSKPTRLPL
jgi:glucose-1-phosphate thymidylyltransferase